MSGRGRVRGNSGRRRTAYIAAAAVLTVGVGTAGYGAGLFAVAPPAAPPAAPVVAVRPSAVAGTAPESATTRPAGTVTVVATGDVLVHPEIWRQARTDGGGRFDFAPMFAGVRQTVAAADLALCHLETPLAEPDGPFLGYPSFSTPPQVLDGLRATGFDGCSTASNHALDHGERGVRRTVAAFDRARLGHTGTYADAGPARRPATYRLGGVTVAHLSYTAHLNGVRPPAGKQWLVNRIEAGRIRVDARRARRSGAGIVLVSLHWGTEYQHTPDATQRDTVQRLGGDENIDAIIGHHAHVVQPFERVDGTWVAYGLGNQLARHAEPVDASREGAMARFTFSRPDGRRWRVTRAEALPTWVDLAPAIRLVDVAAAVRDPATPADRRRVYRAALDRVTAHLRTPAAARAGLSIPTSAA